jgi:hypothetical protein
VVSRARTGSGKTLAYLLPSLHRILTGDLGKAGWQALILVPTRELCEQVGMPSFWQVHALFPRRFQVSRPDRYRANAHTHSTLLTSDAWGAGARGGRCDRCSLRRGDQGDCNNWRRQPARSRGHGG